VNYWKSLGIFLWDRRPVERSDGRNPQGDLVPAPITLEAVDGGSAPLLDTIGVREAHRTMKIWRALWRVAGSLKYGNRDEDPSLGIPRKTPRARDASWLEGQAVRLVNGYGEWTTRASLRRAQSR
jgi:hypothetical protein